MRTNPMMILRVSALALVTLALCGIPAGATFKTSVSAGATERDQDKKFKAKRAESQKVTTSIQKSFDTTENEFLTVFCGALARVTRIADDGAVTSESLKNVKANWSAKLLVIDEGAGTVEAVELGSGSLETGADGRASWRATVETADFADGFPESSSAVVQNEVQFRKGKKVNSLDVFCSYP